jgi:hypothetical protein
MVIVVLAVYVLAEKNKDDRNMPEKKELIISWMPAITPTDLEYRMARDIYAYYGVPGKNNPDLNEIKQLSETKLVPYLFQMVQFADMV